MTLRIWSRLLQEALQKTPFFVQCYILSKSISSKNSKSLALADLKSVSLIFPKRYTYNYHESYHDTVIISLTLHVTWEFLQRCFLTSWDPSESKFNDVTNSLKKRQFLVIACNPMAILVLPVSLFNFRFIWTQCSRITNFFIGLQSHLDILNLGNTALCPFDKNFL